VLLAGHDVEALRVEAEVESILQASGSTAAQRVRRTHDEAGTCVRACVPAAAMTGGGGVAAAVV
jgi:hypothetical protein